MGSLRNHRVVIASLFLPSTAVLSSCTSPPTPQSGAVNQQLQPMSPISIPASAFRTSENLKPSTNLKSPPSQPNHRQNLSVHEPLKSIVEDLTVKSKNAPSVAPTPRDEQANPFAAAQTITGSGANESSQKSPDSPSSPSSARKVSERAPARIQRRNSRSSSRRPSRDPARPTSLHQAWTVEQNPHCNGGLRNAIDSVGGKLKQKLWVGTLGTSTDSFPPVLRADIDRRMSQCQSLPVWIPDAEFEGCYDEFCHQVLWPCLHYIVPDAPKTKYFYESASYKQYVAVNQRFADAIIANYKEGDIIWVNDYHLMLLPALLRASPALPPHVPIGFFLHVAFPSSEIFRCLSARQALLRGLLAADLVGFQTASYARHFRQTVSRILAHEALPKGIMIDNGTGSTRFVDVGVFPMGIDVSALKEKRRDPDVAEWVQVLKQRYAGMKIIVGRDKLDEIQGVRHKIQAFEIFLSKYPEFQKKVVLIQVTLQTTESNELAGGVADLVSHINSRFSTLTYQPIVFLHKDLTFSQYLALLTVADAFLVTSLREGMALRTHEFVECQDETFRPLILSEFTGSYSYSGFRSCIAINPWDTRGTASAINQALTMSDEEALSRWKDLHSHVVTQTAQSFVMTFISRCLRVNAEHVRIDLMSSAEPLDMALLLPRYKHSHRRLILIDFEGTLWQRDISKAGLLHNPFAPPTEALEVVNKLAEDKRNSVWLLSGLAVKGKMEIVSEMVPDVGIVAENGCYIKPRPSREGSSSWINMVANFNLTWKILCLEILHYFTERTPGSFIEEREASIVWRFWTGPITDCADRKWARRQAAEAQNHIFDSLGERYGLRIIPGATSFLVLPNNISRSTAVGAILHPGGPANSPQTMRAPWMSDTGEMSPAHDLDFVLAVSGDEKLLRRLNEFDAASTCSTRGKGTDARWRLEKNDVVKVLLQFANV